MEQIVFEPLKKCKSFIYGIGPIFAVECKTGDTNLQPNLAYYQDRLKIPKMYQVHLRQKDYGHPAKGGRVLPFAKFCLEEEMI